jgi:hypothetical protein
MRREGDIWVFAGPSLPPAARPATDAITWRPPAIAGDGLAALGGPRCIVLVDGFFDALPAIRHKELLALIEAGVRVIGGASMGALRAAELAGHGMIGIGAIFQAYASGRLVRDDEVAVLHGPVEMAWAALTLPLVNVRATLQSAVRERVIGGAAARRLRAVASEIFFQERTWPVLRAAAAGGGIAPDELARFHAWTATGYVDLKQRDARACVAAALATARLPPPAWPRRPTTTFMEALAAQVAAGLRPDPASS